MQCGRCNTHESNRQRFGSCSPQGFSTTNHVTEKSISLVSHKVSETQHTRYTTTPSLALEVCIIKPGDLSSSCADKIYVPRIKTVVAKSCAPQVVANQPKRHLLGLRIDDVSVRSATHAFDQVWQSRWAGITVDRRLAVLGESEH